MKSKVFRVEIVDRYGKRRTQTLFAKSKREAMFIIGSTLSPDDEFVSRCKEV